MNGTRTNMNLTPAQKKALKLVAAGNIETGPGQATMNSLRVKGLVQVDSRGTPSLTDAGRKVIKVT